MARLPCSLVSYGRHAFFVFEMEVGMLPCILCRISTDPFFSKVKIDVVEKHT
jgi:hypothetical protein